MSKNANIRRIVITTVGIIIILTTVDYFFSASNDLLGDTAETGSDNNGFGAPLELAGDDASVNRSMELADAIATNTQAADGMPVDSATNPAPGVPASISGERAVTMQDTPSSSPEAQDGVPKLSPRVFAVIDEVQKRQLDGQWEEALNEMNALYTEFDNLDPFEQVTLLNFFTNVLLHLEMWPESISAFSLMRSIDGLRPDIDARAIRALGQLSAQVGDVDEAIAYYQEWLIQTQGIDGIEEQTEAVTLALLELVDGETTQ